MPAFYFATTFLVKSLLTILTRWRVRGKDRVPRQGPLIVVANHINAIDPPLLSASIPRRIVFMAKEELFDSWFESLIVRGFGAFPVSKRRADREALKRANLVLSQGLALGMFPEGTRSFSRARLQPALRGAALLALRSRAPILPVAISGTERIRGLGWFFVRPRLMVQIGEPFMAPDSDGESTKDHQSTVTDLIMARIAELLPPNYRGVYRNRSGARQASDSGG
ncbi:MAG: lysophospholipid acyltransferase family protein [Dehalococcoidia bacterium]